MSESYHQRRSEIGAYFDRTAAEAWKRLTSDMPVGRIRATVRAGRDAMRSELLSYLPEDLKGARVLDAGCGTGAMSQALAERGAEVVAVDLSPQLVKVAEDRTPQHLLSRIHYRAGDMTSPALGRFDFCVAMDSVIHYEQHDMVACLAKLAERTETAIAWLTARLVGATLHLDDSANGYFSRTAENCDLTGQRTPNDPTDDVAWAGGPANPNCPLIARTVVPAGAEAGYTVSYVINRICNVPGDPGSVVGADGVTPMICSRQNNADSSNSTRAGGSYGSLPLSGVPQTYYRVTTRVMGPRNTVRYVQAFVVA